MDISLGQIIEILLKFGGLGAVCLIWYVDRRDMTKIIEDHRKETSAILDRYNADACSAREMYRNNVKLVEAYEALVRSYTGVVSDLHSTVALNIQKLTEVNDSVKQNQYCPLLRVDKTKIEVGKS